ncbi:MAG: PTS alpha-glucoside transporter subunit IIBC [Methanomethylovorans sp.]|jgi:peptidoglycan/xylan/chitin deacetylase (PgdA/CDA1 family)|nr:PTS alpha-glucoside transporter subunit IIBC [Methanomethylovorans sp.]
MDILITTHTEFGYVHSDRIIPDKTAIDGVRKGVPNLIKIADKYSAKITFAVMPEVVQYFPKDVDHEIGLHIHAGWEKFQYGNFSCYIGDMYLREHTSHRGTSTVLRDYSYKEQFEMIRTGKDYLEEALDVRPISFVSGRWSINNDTVKALIKSGFKYECSATAHSKPCHHDWSKLPRICMPYQPSVEDYQLKGNLPLLEVPISQMFPRGNVNPENIPIYGISWLKACFLEYYNQDAPLFHMCLHSPCMTDPYFVSKFDELLNFISKHKKIHFIFSSEISDYENFVPKNNIFPYLVRINSKILKLGFNAIKLKVLGSRE